MQRKNKSISFCTTSCNRLWQLESTLLENLSSIGDDCEIVLVDYGSTDGLSEWVWENFRQFIECRKLIYFEVKGDVRWNVSKAKNLAHRISTGAYLFNLDADNYVSSQDVNCIKPLLELDVASHQWSGVWSDGSFGRIGLPRDLFFRMGGYDESMLPMGGQDIDLLWRLNAMGVLIKKLPPPKTQAVLNQIIDKVSEIDSSIQDRQSLYSVMNKINLRKARVRLKIEGPLLVGGFSTYKGLMNGIPVVIDGFDEIRAG